MIKYDPPKIICEICGSKNIYKFHESENGAQIFKCRECKTQFMNPQYSEDHLNHYYSTYIRDESFKEDNLIEAQSYCLSIVESQVPDKGNLLELGSGNGYLLDIAKLNGWKPFGHEIDCISAGKLSERLGLEILCGDFLTLEIDKTFDAVIMLHVLEHLKDPVEHLNKISGLLNKGGVLFIALPNIESRSGLVKLGLEKLKIKKKNVAAYYDTEHHLWYYTPATIRKLLEKNFDVITVYSGDRFNPVRGKLNTIIEEKIFSKLLWHSSMGILAVKK